MFFWFGQVKNCLVKFEPEAKEAEPEAVAENPAAEAPRAEASRVSFSIKNIQAVLLLRARRAEIRGGLMIIMYNTIIVLICFQFGCEDFLGKEQQPVEEEVQPADQCSIRTGRGGGTGVPDRKEGAGGPGPKG